MDFDWLPILAIVIGLPWVILHYVTKWKTAATLTVDDETMLDELYQLARRLDDRMDTVERLVADDNPDFKTPRLRADREIDNQPLREIERHMAQRGRPVPERPYPERNLR